VHCQAEKKECAMKAVAERVAYHTTLREMASEERPRERLQ
jgi:hypothetical protein